MIGCGGRNDAKFRPHYAMPDTFLYKGKEIPNMELNFAPSGHWALRDKTAQRRLALR